MMANWNYGHEHFPADVGVQAGRVASQDIAAGSYTDVSVTFSKAFQAAPIVTVCFETDSGAGAFGGCVAAVYGAPTATGFTARLYNSDTSKRSPRLVWTAVGTPK